MTKEKQIQMLKDDIKYIKRMKKYILRRDELQAIGLHNFISGTPDTEEFKKEWRQVNKVIDENNWSTMWAQTRDFDKEIAEDEKLIKELEQE